MFEEQLSNYYSILRGEKKAKYLEADIDELIERAKELMEPCKLCEIRCGAKRLSNELGYCRAGFRISSEFLHVGEEEFLVPSHTIFFIGCNFRCVFCQNWEISQGFEEGVFVEPERLARIIARKARISRNVNWVGGEPTPNLLYVLQVLKEMQKLEINIPQIWNTNAYMSKEALEILNEVIDFWLPDFKYGNNACAFRLSKVRNYFEVITRNLKLMEGDMLIRHLVLPNHVECCSFKVLDWIAENLGKRAVVNIMDQYYPCYRAFEFEEISRRLKREEFLKVLNYAEKLKLVVYH